jgi:hypothetical protein
MKYERLKAERLEIRKAKGINIPDAFLLSVLQKGTRDTRNFRYAAQEVNGNTHQWIEIRRLPIRDLDTTAALDGWETVCTIGETDGGER